MFFGVKNVLQKAVGDDSLWMGFFLSLLLIDKLYNPEILTEDVPEEFGEILPLVVLFEFRQPVENRSSFVRIEVECHQDPGTELLVAFENELGGVVNV